MNEQPSLFRKFTRWLGDFERAMEMRPGDDMELRVADIERRLAVLDLQDLEGRPSNKLPIARRV